MILQDMSYEIDTCEIDEHEIDSLRCLMHALVKVSRPFKLNDAVCLTLFYYFIIFCVEQVQN